MSFDAVVDDVFVNFKLKMKKINLALAKWSKDNFGDIFKQLVIWKEVVKVKENKFEYNPTGENKSIVNKAHVEFTKYLKYEEDFWRQIVGMQWFSEGDRITRIFIKL